MSVPLFIALAGNDAMARQLAEATGGEIGMLEMRRFPDGESYLRFASGVAGRSKDGHADRNPGFGQRVRKSGSPG